MTHALPFLTLPLRLLAILVLVIVLTVSWPLRRAAAKVDLSSSQK